MNDRHFGNEDNKNRRRMAGRQLSGSGVRKKYPHNNDPWFYYTPESGNWEYDGQLPKSVQSLDLTTIIREMLSDDRLKEVEFKDIAWRHKHRFPYGAGHDCKCCGGIAYRECDPSVPGIIAYNCANPFDNKYRMLDGRHRIMRHLFSGKSKGLFYVFDFNEIKHFMRSKNNSIVIEKTISPHEAMNKYP